jgi:hypothetical protein
MWMTCRGRSSILERQEVRAQASNEGKKDQEHGWALPDTREMANKGSRCDFMKKRKTRKRI